MRFVCRDEFENLAKTWGMQSIDDRFGFSQEDLESPWWWPKRKSDGELTRPWQLSHLIVDAIEAARLGERIGYFVYPPEGCWSWNKRHEAYRVTNAIIESVRIPYGFDGAAHFDDAEIDRLAAVVFARCFMIDDCIGDSTDDTWVYPAHGRLYLHFDDEEITWAMTDAADTLKQFDDEIIRRGWGWLREPDSQEDAS